jgi:hypothetical protein
MVRRSQTKARMNVVLGLTAFLLGLAECAVTQIWHLAEWVLLA